MGDFFLRLKRWDVWKDPKGWAGAIVSILIAAVYFAQVFSVQGFIGGSSSYWHTQVDDATEALSGLTAFRSEPWGLPLLRINSMNWPTGTTVPFTDAIPLLALVVKLVGPMAPTNPFGIWVLSCFLFMGLASWWTIKQTGKCTWASLVIAVCLCVEMPALTNRLGHLSLMAHFLIVLALGLYFRDQKSRKVSVMGWAVLVTAAFYVNFYLTAMVLSIMLASAGDLARHAHLRDVWRYVLTLLPVMVSFPLMYGSGFGSSLKEGGFNFFSMNLLAPITGGSLIPAYGLGTIGQYEGYNYLGLGLLGGAVALAFTRSERKGREIGPALLCVCVGLFFYAMSNDIYVGTWHLAHWNIPRFLVDLTDTFRSSGRFFWPVAYVTAFWVALSLTKPSVRTLLAAVAILGLQWVDLSSVRLVANVASRRPPQMPADVGAWSTLLTGVNTIYFYPKFRCGKADHSEILPIQQIAATLQIKMSTGYISRYVPDCNAEASETATAELKTSAFVYSSSDFTLHDAKQHAPPDVICRQQNQWILCR